MIYYLINYILVLQGYQVQRITEIFILIPQDNAYVLYVRGNSHLSHIANCSVSESLALILRITLVFNVRVFAPPLIF